MIPLELPVRAGEAAALADMILQLAYRKVLNDDLRQRIASRGAALKLQAMTPYYGSLQRDPSHQSAYFLAVDGRSAGKPQPLLLRFAPASSPASALFPQSILIGRMRPGAIEIVVNAVPFSHDTGEAIRGYVEQVDPSFLPRTQGPQSAIAVRSAQPEIDLPAAFAAFRGIHKKAGVNVASIAHVAATAESAGRFYETTLWAALRAGWREGYNLGAELTLEGSSVEAAKETIREAAGYTRFMIDASALFETTAAGHPEERFRQLLGEEDGAWCLDEFSRPFPTGDADYQLTTDEIMQLAVKFHRSLMVSEQLYDHIRAVKAQNRTGRMFDFEVSMAGADSTTPRELLFYLHWLKSRGRAAQLVAPHPARLSELTGVARFFNATLSVDSDADVEQIGRTGGRWNCTVDGAEPERIAECWDRLRAG